MLNLKDTLNRMGLHASYIKYYNNFVKEAVYMWNMTTEAAEFIKAAGYAVKRNSDGRYMVF